VNRWALAVWLGALVYALAYATLDWWRWATYHASYDFAVVVQIVLSGFPHLYNPEEAASHFTRHFSPIFGLLTPFVATTHSVVPLFFIQAIAGALVAPGLYAIAVRRLAPPLAAGVASIAFIYPPLAGVIFADPTENVFVPAATVWLLCGLDGKRYWLAATAAIVLLATKEDQGLFLAAVGLALALWFRRREPGVARFSLALACAGALTFVLYFTVIRPAAGATDPWPYTHFYAWGRPGLFAEAPLGSPGRFTYLLEAFAPLLFVPFGSPALVLALPGFAEVLASHESMTFRMGTPYAATWLGYVLVAYVLGIARIATRSPRRARNYALGSAIVCVLVLAFASPTHWRHYLSWPNAHDAALDRVLASLPQDAAVGTYEEAYSHLGFDRNAAWGWGHHPDYILIDETMTGSLAVRGLIDRVRTDSDFALRSRDDGIKVYRRKGTERAH